MHINEAVKRALQTKGLIYREGGMKKNSELYAVIQPTNSYETSERTEGGEICESAKGGKSGGIIYAWL